MTPRRWFRFSLRTMLVGVTLFGCWLGWEHQIVRRRAAEIKHIESRGGTILPSVPFYASTSFSDVSYPDGHFETPHISWVRQLLGDHPVGLIQLPDIHLVESKVQSLRKLFPEVKSVTGAPQQILPEDYIPPENINTDDCPSADSPETKTDQP